MDDLVKRLRRGVRRVDMTAADNTTAERHRAQEAADRIEALEAALRDASDKAAVIAEAWVRRAMHLSPDGYEIERRHGAMASQAANDIRRALTAPLHPTPSPDPQSAGETAPR